MIAVVIDEPRPGAEDAHFGGAGGVPVAQDRRVGE